MNRGPRPSRSRLWTGRPRPCAEALPAARRTVDGRSDAGRASTVAGGGRRGAVERWRAERAMGRRAVDAT